MNRANFDKQTAGDMNNCCKNFFDREGLQGEMNEPMQFCPYCGRQLNDKEFTDYNKRLGEANIIRISADPMPK